MIKSRQIIKNLKEPKVLYLMWQDNTEARNRYLIGKLYKDKFEYLLEDDNFQKAKDNGFIGFLAFSLNKKVHTGNVLSVFLSRCPQKERASYEKFLSSFALSPEQEEVKNLTDFMLLAYTGAYIPSDSFHLLNPFIDIEPPFEFIMRIAGADRRYKDFDDLDSKEGESLTLEKEPANENNSNAIKINFKDKHLGYIQNGLVESFHDWLERGYNVNLSIYRVNGSPEYRYVYAFVEVSK